jgi:hypothetical protein
VEADILNVVPPHRLHRQLERPQPDPAASVPVGDLGNPRPQLALPHAMVAGVRWRREVDGVVSTALCAPRLPPALWMSGGE